MQIDVDGVLVASDDDRVVDDPIAVAERAVNASVCRYRFGKIAREEIIDARPAQAQDGDRRRGRGSEEEGSVDHVGSLVLRTIRMTKLE